MKEIDEVLDEVLLAENKFAPFHSSYEGYVVILEEVDELWDEVKKHPHDYTKEYHEAKQIACTAIRYMRMCQRRDCKI